MQAVWQTLVLLLEVLVQLVVNVGLLVAPWLPLIAWVAFWLLAVNWVKLRETLLQGGAIGVALLGFVTVLIWGLLAPPPDGSHHLLGLTVSNFYGKLIYVTTLICIMLLCGSVQLSGLVSCCVDFSRYETAPDDHGHDAHGHGHDSHGHDPGHGSQQHGAHGH